MNFQDLESRRYFIAVGGFLAVLFALLGPEGSTGLGLAARLLQWTAQVAIPLALLIASHLLLSRSNAFERQNAWLKLTISGVVGSLLFAPLALALDFAFDVDDWQQVHTPQQLLAMFVNETLAVLFPVTLVWVGINAPRVIGLDFSQSPRPSRETQQGPAAQADQHPAQGFLGLIPAEIGTDIMYLMSELHYLRVVTKQGSTLVLYNLRDAVGELPADTGLQPHRSYWVALKHVDRLSRCDGKAYVRLTDGSRIPVSRRRLSDVKARIAPA